MFDNLPPTTPAGFNPAASQRTKPTMSWTAATDTGGAGIDHYDVWQAGSPDVLAGIPTTTSFTDAAITIEATYAYVVRAVDKAGNTGPPTAVKSITYDVTAPTVPTGLVASASPTGAKPAFAFSAATDTGGTGVTSYRLYRDGASVATAAGTTVTDTALTVDGSYGYRVSALDAAGNESALSSAVTVVYDKTAPPVATALTAAATPTNTKPALTWTAGGADGLSGFARYDIYRGAVLAGSSATAAFTDAALSTSGSYSYTVKAVDHAGNSSNASTAKIVVYDVIAPPVPGSFAAPAATKVKPTLTFTAAADTGGSGTDHYNVYRDDVLLGVALTTSYTETSPTYPDGSYSYTVSAVDKAGNEGPETTPKVVVYDTTAPIAPATPTTSAPVTKVKPAISWTATTDPGGSGVASYTVYRDGVQIAAAAVGTSYQDTALAANGTYAYAIRANDAAGNASTITATVSVTYDTVAPPVPVSLTGTTPTGSNPALTWTSGGPDALSGFDHYEILRAGANIGTSTGAAFTHTGASSGSNVYTVKAVDEAGNVSAASAAKTIVFDNTPPGQPSGLAGASPSNLPALTWSAPTDVSGINHYEVFRDAVSIGTTTATTYVDTPAPSEGTYVYTVAAVDNAGNSGVPSAGRTIVVDGTPPPVPVSLAGASPTSTKPVLTWSSGGPDLGSGFARYNVYRNGALAGTATGHELQRHDAGGERLVQLHRQVGRRRGQRVGRVDLGRDRVGQRRSSHPDRPHRRRGRDDDAASGLVQRRRRRPRRPRPLRRVPRRHPDRPGGIDQLRRRRHRRRRHVHVHRQGRGCRGQRLRRLEQPQRRPRRDGTERAAGDGRRDAHPDAADHDLGDVHGRLRLGRAALRHLPRRRPDRVDGGHHVQRRRGSRRRRLRVHHPRRGRGRERLQPVAVGVDPHRPGRAARAGRADRADADEAAAPDVDAGLRRRDRRLRHRRSTTCTATACASASSRSPTSRTPPSPSTTPTATRSPRWTGPATSRTRPAPPRCCSTTRRRRRRAA